MAAARAAMPRSQPSSGLFARVQQGIGRLVASSYEGTTSLTTISHQAPVRLIPLRSSAVASASAAVCFVGNYGGGILPGDSLEHHVHVRPHAKLGLVTQGSNRIYQRPNSDTTEKDVWMSTTRSEYRVDDNGLLIVAPDPVTPFKGSNYRQHQIVHASSQSSFCLIDWFSAGRFVNGERWQSETLSNRTDVYLDNQWVLRDAVSMTQPVMGMDWSTVQFNAYASMILHGSALHPVVHRCRQLQSNLMAQSTMVRSTSSDDDDDDDAVILLQSLAGRVVVGMTQISQLLHVARMAATSNEDLYRVFHHCLKPISLPIMGFPFYQDRIRAVRSAEVDRIPTTHKVDVGIVPGNARSDDDLVVGLSPPSTTTTSTKYWTSFLLADSALPTGSFAHSSGLEVAAQLQIVKSTPDVAAFVQAATRSSLHMNVWFLDQTHRLVAAAAQQHSIADLDSSFVADFKKLDDEAHVLLVSNGPSCRASLDQGRSLLRICSKWFADSGLLSHNQLAVVQSLQSLVAASSSNGHVSTVFGVFTALVGLNHHECSRLFGYCVARDIVSASVRLNLIGPMASVSLLSDAERAAAWGARDGRRQSGAPSGCAPILDAIQPCHDQLSVRLFRT